MIALCPALGYFFLLFVVSWCVMLGCWFDLFYFLCTYHDKLPVSTVLAACHIFWYFVLLFSFVSSYFLISLGLLLLKFSCAIDFFFHFIVTKKDTLYDLFFWNWLRLILWFILEKFPSVPEKILYFAIVEWCILHVY